jgi:hypothetical protein
MKIKLNIKKLINGKFFFRSNSIYCSSLIVEIILFFICLCDYSSEDFYIKTNEKEWNKYPILDLILIPKEGLKKLYF